MAFAASRCAALVMSRRVKEARASRPRFHFFVEHDPERLSPRVRANYHPNKPPSSPELQPLPQLGAAGA